MRRTSLRVDLLLVLLVGLARPVFAQDIPALSFEQLTVANTAVSLSFSTLSTGGKTATRCVGVVETASIRYRIDGTAATASIGHLVPIGATVDVRGADNVRRFSAIRTASTSAVLPMTCYAAPAESASFQPTVVDPSPAVAMTGTFSTSVSSPIVSATGTFQVNGVVAVSATAPTIASGFGTTSSVVASNGTAAFTIDVGTGGSATAGVITMPTATTGWACSVENLTALAANVADARTVQTATTTTSVTVENQTVSTGVALAWTASDVLMLKCIAY